MSEHLERIGVETLQQRLIEETEVQRRLQDELKAALQSERSLRLENDILWAYLKREHPQRVKDARGLLTRLVDGSDLSTELLSQQRADGAQFRSLKKRVRGAIGKVPGVQRIYHGLKKLRT